jgi:hypothetical protein
MIVAEELNTAAIDLGFYFVADRGKVALCQALIFFRCDKGDGVGHRASREL